MSIKTIRARHILGAFAAILSAVLVGLTSFMNYRMGYSLGSAEDERTALGIVAVCIEGVAVIMTFLVVAAWVNGKHAWAAIGALTWVACLTLSFLSSIGFQASNRADHAAARGFEMAKYESNSKAVARLEEEAKFVPAHRPAKAILPEMETARASKLWKATAECTNEVTKRQRNFCTKYRQLRAEHASAVDAIAIADRIAEARQKFEATPAVYGDEDAGTSTFASITGFDSKSISTAIVLFFGAVITLLSAVMPKLTAACFKEPDLKAGKAAAEKGASPFVVRQIEVEAPRQKAKIAPAADLPRFLRGTVSPTMPSMLILDRRAA
jgi:hypothetical protein